MSMEQEYLVGVAQRVWEACMNFGDHLSDDDKALKAKAGKVLSQYLTDEVVVQPPTVTVTKKDDGDAPIDDEVQAQTAEPADAGTEVSEEPATEPEAAPDESQPNADETPTEKAPAEQTE